MILVGERYRYLGVVWQLTSETTKTVNVVRINRRDAPTGEKRSFDREDFAASAAHIPRPSAK